MVLSAIVPCKCYQLSRTKPLPFPDLISLRESGCVEINRSYSEDNEKLNAFWDWEKTACEHRYLTYDSVEVAPWAHYNPFLLALRNTGWEHFPTLEKYLVSLEETGYIPTEAVAGVKKELETFREIYQGRTTALINAETHEKLKTIIAPFVFLLEPPYRIGFGPRGFYIQDWKNPDQEFFSSLYFEQRPRPEQKDFVYTDIETGKQFMASAAITEDRTECLKIRILSSEGSNFDYILDSLLEICQAALDIESTVVWC